MSKKKGLLNCIELNFELCSELFRLKETWK